ncbi:MAG: YkgJ family cysteine cluster protein [Isosphaeraceae bacterium]
MPGSDRRLPLIESCEGCGACCRVVGVPPFLRRFDAEGEERWEALRRDRPRLVEELENHERALRSEGLPREGRPCLWFDAEILGCRHYDWRPQACREFAINSVDCHDARRRAGVSERTEPN